MPTFVAICMVKHLGFSKQIATKTHARLIQTHISFGCVLFFVGLAANFAADGAGSRLESVSRAGPQYNVVWLVIEELVGRPVLV